MRMNAEFSLQLLLLLPVSFVSAAAVSYFMPRAGAVDNAVVAKHMETGKDVYVVPSFDD